MFRSEDYAMRKTIIGAIALILALAVLLGLTLALAKSAERKQPGKIVWDAGRCALSWTGKNGEAFVIDFHKGTMTDGKKTYPLSQIEQAEVHEALNFFRSEER